MADQDPYIDKNTGILKNLVGASTQDALDQKEAEYSNARLAQLEGKPLKGKFDLKHMQALHKHIFQDVYAFAGKTRFVDIVKNNTRFAYNGAIESSFQKLSDELKKENYLKGTSPEKFAQRAAYYLGEINMIHPFREGNGRTQRAFIGELARNAGHKIDWTKIQSKQMVNASIHAENMNYKPLATLIQEAMPQVSHAAEQTQTQAKSSSSRLKR